jgi:hypothetical protein
MTKKRKAKTFADVASQGGKARAEALSPEDRTDIARHAAETRWLALKERVTPRATHTGELAIGSVSLPCAVLEDGTRVLTLTGILKAIGRTGESTGSDPQTFNLPVFLRAKNLKPFISDELRSTSEPIKFRMLHVAGRGGSSLTYGFRAEILPLVCQVFIEAGLSAKLSAKQMHIAEKCRSLAKGFGIVGITALIDEATGYQEIRDRAALQQILDKYLRKELAAWAKRFPDDFYVQIFRLKGWPWKGMKVNRPGVVAAYTKDLVYARLAPALLEELEKLNPISDGRRPSKHHQWLTTDVGHPRLQEHLIGVIAIMKGSATWDHARRMIQRAYPKVNTNLDLPFPEKEGEA